MTIPSIFQWPSPWLWGAIGVLVLTGADGFFELLQSVAVVTIIASGIHYVRTRRAVKHVTPPAPGDMERRLDAIERRLTDTQDVMINLSEKVDQWEDRTKEPERQSEARS